MIVNNFLKETLNNTLISVCKNERGENEVRIIREGKIIALISDIILIYNNEVYVKVKEWLNITSK